MEPSLELDTVKRRFFFVKNLKITNKREESYGDITRNQQSVGNKR